MTGLSRLDSVFSRLRAQRRPALMPFITAGYPSLEVTRRVLPELEKSGAAAVEIGFPFSDPIADGAVIAASMHESLQAGITPDDIFTLVKELRPKTSLALIAMVSDSIVTRIGPEQFVGAAAQAGFDGLIVPDIDLNAARPLFGLARLHHLSFTLLVAPTSTPRRIKEVTALCSGFVYLLARVGITGESTHLDEQLLARRVALVREHTDLPIAVGFGISKAEHVQAVARFADAAIVGSALVRRMGESADPVKAASDFVRELAAGVSGGSRCR
jgi:tryptophan synthase alpha chain